MLEMSGATDSEEFLDAVIALPECELALANLKNLDAVPSSARAGLINPEIALRLGISIEAANLCLQGAFKKLKARNRTQIVAILRG
jgi:hypothetical protein